MKTYSIRIKGIVQGVGFRPFIYKLALQTGIKGTVNNDSKGVIIKVTVAETALESFIEDIKLYKPPLSQIDSIEYKEISYRKYSSFAIIDSESLEDQVTIIPPDISICDDCLNELNDPNNRRYKYPFITCTNCGPRYTIIEHLPYDRSNTSMKDFPMCEDCKKEYNDPMDRRYHAQPIGCFDCGPSLELRDKNDKIIIDQNEIIEKVVELIKLGNIIAVKGVGGYHLVCDAQNNGAVEKLRDRKHRPHKPFALLVKDIRSAKELAYINSKEQKLLESHERPIVLLNKKAKNSLGKNIAPDIDKIGLFLPYTPLHELIVKRLDKPLIATSANLSDEPLCINIKELKRLSNVWDYCLDHNREIVNGCDDSVAAVVNDQTLFFRRSRGYAPKAMKSPIKFIQNVISLGANQKSTIAIGYGDNIILSPHIGDLKSIQSVNYFKNNIENLRRIYEFEPDVVVCDAHAGYESTKYANELHQNCIDLKVIKTQHHYAHILAVMIEKKLNKKVLGVSFDGTGLGDDGNLWGGEFMVCDFKNYTRVAHLKYFKLLGAEKAIKEPRRVALSLLFDVYGKRALSLKHPVIEAFNNTELNNLYISWERGLNTPLTSSMGRLFDAVASLCGLINILSYEGQSGAMMESYYDKTITLKYDWELNGDIIDIDQMIIQIVQNDESITNIVSKFINTIVDIIVTVFNKYNLPLVLSGGVFQNIVLLKQTLDKIPESIFSNLVPPNDGAISLGQIIKGR